MSRIFNLALQLAKLFSGMTRKEAITLSSKLFALDIGTRSVVGIILQEENDHFHVEDILVKEHKERAMVDGQIHNVMYVAELINEIKQELTEKHGTFNKSKCCGGGALFKNRTSKRDH